MLPLCSEGITVSCTSSLLAFTLVFAILTVAVLLLLAGWLLTLGNKDDGEKARKLIHSNLFFLLTVILGYGALALTNPEFVRVSEQPLVTSDREQGRGQEPLEAQCKNCINVVDLGVPITEHANPYVSKPLAAKLKELSVLNKTWRVTEAYPPTVPHINSCHRDGTCVDIGVYPRILSASLISQLCKDGLMVGLDITNEYNDPNINLSGSGCPISLLYETTSGGHLHVK